MIPTPSGNLRVWIAAGHTDMRRGMQGLALQVQEQLKRDPHADDLYIFPRAQEATWRRSFGTMASGYRCMPKRLDRGRVHLAIGEGEGVVSISAGQMAYMLEGIDWRNPQLTWRPKSAG